MRVFLSTVVPAAVVAGGVATGWLWRRWDGLALLALMIFAAIIVLRLAFWLVLRPLAAGRVEPRWERAYAVGAVTALVAIAIGVWTLRGRLLACHLVTLRPAVVIGAGLAAAAVALGAWATCTLGWSRLVCVPILFGSRGAGPARLETSGPYALCRNPIYLAELLILAGTFLASGVVAVGMVLGAWAAMTAVVVQREDRELRARFGPAYDAYAARVPALLPWPRH